MLTKDLMRVTVRKGEVKPGWLDPTAEKDLERAGRLVDIFQSHVGASRRDLDDVLAVETGSERDFRVRRGLAKLLWDRTETTVAGELDPAEVRAAVFEGSAGIALSEPDRRERIFAAAAASLGASPSAVEEALFADLSANQTVLSVKPIDASGLLHRYNVALAQGVLLKANELRVTLLRPTPKRLRQLVRLLKFHRLMFSASPVGSDWRITVDGPTSVLKHSTRYGLNLANFFPALLLCEAWSLEADYQPKRGARTATFTIDSSAGLRSHYRDTGTWVADEEVALAERMAELAAPWRADTDGRIIDLGGNGVLIPDLVLSCPETGAEAFVEVIWRWRRGALQARWELLQQHGPSNLVLAICGAGQDEAAPELPGAVHHFKQIPNARTLWKLAREVASPAA